MRFRRLLLALLILIAPAGARAHPHEWVDVASEVVFDGQGRVAAIRHHWRFDEGFSAFALQGLDSNGDRVYSPAELQPLAQENVESLGDFEFFTFVSAGDYKAGFGAPKDYHLDWDGERLTLHFTLPLAQPLFTTGQILVQVYDPEYYIAFSLPGREAVRFVGAPANCRLAVFPAAKPDPAAAAALATIGPDQRELPDEMQGLATGIDNSAEIDCGAPAAVAAAGGPGARNANEAVSEMAGPAGAAGDLSMLTPDEPANGSGAPAPAAAASPTAASSAAAPSSGGFTARLAAVQTAFNGQLNAALKAMRTDFSAFWWLGGVSFLYGIVHAAGPGHGKVVISSYLLANEQRFRRGVVIAFLSALVQAIVAVAIVGIMAVLLNMTSMAITSTAKLFEMGSFALVAALGLYLLVRKGKNAWAMLRGGDPHAGHDHGQHGHGHHGHGHHGHGHHHDHHGHVHAHGPAGYASSIKWDETAASCACAHHADPAALDKPGLSGAAAAVLSVGMRPCSGALVVLVFALAQGIFWAGIASTFLMAFGTAITVAVLAALAVGAKDVAARLFQADDRRSAQVMLGLEVAAALFITALGAVLFAGSLAA